MFKFVAKLIENLKAKLTEKGQGMVEYALIIAVVAVIAAVVLNTNLAAAITNAFTNAGEQIDATTDDMRTSINAGNN